MSLASKSVKHQTVAILGGGVSGICSAIQLEKQLDIKSYTIFEQNEDFGGTWWANRYPGCACDIQSHFYSLSFAPNPYWTQNYSSQPEIQAYLLKVAKDYGLYSHAKFSTRVNSIEWDESQGKWFLDVENLQDKTIQQFSADFVVNAVGALRAPYTPEEFKKFKGPLIHSAEWDSTIELKNKKVGIVGSGSSASQIIPKIASTVGELHSYQRRPAWVQTRVQFSYPKFVQFLFAFVPLIMWVYRCLNFLFNEIHVSVFQYKSWLHKKGTSQAKSHLENETVGNESLREKLKPNYSLGCKRILFSETYYKTFMLPHVHLHREKITKIEGSSITTADGETQKLDVLILATGYKVQDFFAPLTIRGKDNLNLIEYWKKGGPQTYYGIMANVTPNSFFLLGPNTVLGHNSVIFMIECQVHFMVQVIKEKLNRNAKSVTVSKRAEEEWMKEVQKNLKTTVWGNEGCNSWYADKEGRITALWPKSCIAYYNETKSIDFNKMDFSY